MSKEIEEWRDIKGFEKLYQVSDWGRVKSLDRTVTENSKYGHTIDVNFKGRMLKQPLDKDGYCLVGLHKNGKTYNKRVHILVAETFIPNPQNKPIVGHLKTLPNGLEDKTANEVWHLAWMTYPENSTYGTLSERKSEIMVEGYKTRKRKKVWLGKKRIEHAKALSIPIVEIKEDGTVVEWNGISECAEIIGASAPHLNNAVNGKNRKKGHGYRTSLFYKKDEYEQKLLEDLCSQELN